MLTGKPWTDDEIAVVLDTSLSIGEVAFRLGRSYDSVACKAYRLGCTRQARFTPREDGIIRRAVQEVADRLGRDVRAVAGRAVTVVRSS